MIIEATGAYSWQSKECGALRRELGVNLRAIGKNFQGRIKNNAVDGTGRKIRCILSMQEQPGSRRRKVACSPRSQIPNSAGRITINAKTASNNFVGHQLPSDSVGPTSTRC